MGSGSSSNSRDIRFVKPLAGFGEVSGGAHLGALVGKTAGVVSERTTASVGGYRGARGALAPCSRSDLLVRRVARRGKFMDRSFADGVDDARRNPTKLCVLESDAPLIVFTTQKHPRSFSSDNRWRV